MNFSNKYVISLCEVIFLIHLLLKLQVNVKFAKSGKLKVIGCSGSLTFNLLPYAKPAQKSLKDRKGRVLSFEDILHYQKIIVALVETDRLMREIDEIFVF